MHQLHCVHVLAHLYLTYTHTDTLHPLLKKKNVNRPGHPRDEREALIKITHWRKEIHCTSPKGVPQGSMGQRRQACTRRFDKGVGDVSMEEMHPKQSRVMGSEPISKKQLVSNKGRSKDVYKFALAQDEGPTFSCKESLKIELPH